MTEEAEVDEPVAAAAGRRRVLPLVPAAPPSTLDKQNAVAVQCYKCGGPNHFARDCRWNVMSTEVWKSTTILTAGRKCLLSHGVGSITLTVTNRNPLKTNVPVVNSKPLGFNLLLGMDVIKKLGGVHIDKRGKAHFALGATIELEQPDFRAEFDQHTKSWTVSWKWSDDQPP